jgi:hypothetical protein
MNNKYKSWIIIISIIGILVSLWLVINELIKSQYCPPLFGIPACYLVLIFFIFVLVSQFIKNIKISSIIFFIGIKLGLATAIWFSVNQLLEKAYCPILFNIPLCFVSFVTFVVLLILGLKGNQKA